MSTHNVTNEQLAQFVLGELSPERVSEMEAHLRQCEPCRQAVGRLQSLLDCAGRMSDVPHEQDAVESANRRVLLAARTENKDQSRHRVQTPVALFGRMIMKNRITQLAAAAVVVVAAVAGLPLLGPWVGGSVTFAEVIQPILNARTVAVDMIVGEDETGPAFHDLVKGSRIHRTVSNMNGIVILDLDAGRMLSLDPEAKSAVYVDIQGPIQEGTGDYLGLVREIVTRLNARPDLPVTDLGRREIDGQEAVGFQVSEDNTQLTIWADAKTALPRRIEIRQGQSFTILKNIEFDVPVDDALVSMDVPAGYTLHDAELNMREFTEQDFIETLRLWSKLMLDGGFPESLRLEDLMGQMRQLGEKVAGLDVPGEEKLRLGMTLWRGYSFFHTVAHQGTYHYAGRGAKLGEAGKAIFWYQPQGSPTYRVLYADLSVKDVAPEDLPE
jgi:hypothetical protein